MNQAQEIMSRILLAQERPLQEEKLGMVERIEAFAEKSRLHNIERMEKIIATLEKMLLHFWEALPNKEHVASFLSEDEEEYLADAIRQAQERKKP